MQQFSHEERQLFMRFTWGRSRLPLTLEGFTQRFRLQRFNKSPPDNYFPVAHTCFFSLELPSYSSEEIMKQRLSYAIRNCTAIDADETGTAISTAGMGWED